MKRPLVAGLGWLLLACPLALAVGGAGCTASGQEALIPTGLTADEWADRLVSYALAGPGESELDHFRPYAALVQLRQLARSHAISPGVLARLLDGGDFTEAALLPFFGRGMALATGGPEVDRLVFKKVNWTAEAVDSNMDFVVALALAEHPAPDVTKQLREYASEAETASLKKGLCSLVLAARGDNAEDWMGHFSRALAVLSGKGTRNGGDESRQDESAAARLRMVSEVLCFAPKIHLTPAIEQSLWTMVTEEPKTSDLTWFALIAYARSAGPVPDSDKIAYIRGLLDDAPSQGARMLVHLALARLGADPSEETAAALSVVATFGNHTDWAVLQMCCACGLIDDEVAAGVQKGLGASAADVRYGALIVAFFMGPDASPMLQDVTKLLKDEDPRTAEQAPKTRLVLGGLDADGDWKLAKAMTPGPGPEKTDASALLRAATDGNAAEVKRLLEAGAALNPRDEFGKSPLHWAAEFHEPDIVEMLLAAGAKVNARDKEYQTPLHSAVDHFREGEDPQKILPTVALLLDKGADPNAKDRYGWTPLRLAAVGTLSEKEERESYAKNAKIGPEDLEERMKFHGGVVRSELAAIKLLLDRGADVNTKDSEGDTPLYAAVNNPSGPEVVGLLLDRGAKPNMDGRFGTVLEDAIFSGDAETVAVLLNKGADPNGKDSDGDTPLCWAVWRCEPQIARLLLDRGADPNLKGKDGETPLSRAMEYVRNNGDSATKYREIAELLRQRGAKE